jgi:hypothetical protein
MSDKNSDELTVNDCLMAVGVLGLVIAVGLGFVTYANRHTPNAWVFGLITAGVAGAATAGMVLVFRGVGGKRVLHAERPATPATPPPEPAAPASFPFYKVVAAALAAGAFGALQMRPKDGAVGPYTRVYDNGVYILAVAAGVVVLWPTRRGPNA